MPPVASTAQLGWKAFFALLAFMQIVGLGVMWRTYDAVQKTSGLTALHDYQITQEIKPAIAELKNRNRP